MATIRHPFSRRPQTDPSRRPQRLKAMGSKTAIDSRRYRKVRWFFFKTLLQMVLLEALFSLPVLRWIKPPALPRWQKVARRYKQMAVAMGGVLIKLGQFISTRVDLLPPEVLHELAGLQDRVAPARYEAMVKRVEKDFACNLPLIFPFFAAEPIGSASLAQAHAASLPDGTDVIVKILRPDIEVLVATDLEVMERVCRWLNRFGHIRARMNLDQLMDEFAATTRKELDMAAELSNLQRFAADFADDPLVYVPKAYEEYCGRRLILTIGE